MRPIRSLIVATVALLAAAPVLCQPTPGAVADGEAASLPAPRSQGGVAFVTGGIGEAEDQAFRAALPRYALALQFAARSGEGAGDQHLSDVDVRIVDGSKREILRTIAEGPWLLVDLPPGRYVVTAEFSGMVRAQSVQVGPRARRHVVFLFRP
jgi:hypothetical protein